MIRQENCQWSGCLVPLVYNGRGQPPKYCPEHAKESKLALDRARPDYGKTRKRYPQCCVDAQTAGVRAYGSETIRYQDWRETPFYELYIRTVRVGSAHIKSANVRVCAQHSQWRAFHRQSRLQLLVEKSEARGEKNDPLLYEIKESGAFRLTLKNPNDYMVRDNPLELTKAGVKVGYDADLERETRAWLARN